MFDHLEVDGELVQGYWDGQAILIDQEHQLILQQLGEDKLRLTQVNAISEIIHHSPQANTSNNKTNRTWHRFKSI